MGSARYNDLHKWEVIGLSSGHIYPDYMAGLDLPIRGRFLPE